MCASTPAASVAAASPLHLCIPSTPALLDGCAAIVGQAFGYPLESASNWLSQRVGVPQVRALVSDDAVVGNIGVVPMGQHVGGRSVRIGGVLGVAIAAHQRGRGLARKMLCLSLREQRDAGLALSVLYPSTLHVYRSVGYESAGGNYVLSIAPRDIRCTVRSGLAARPLTDADMPAVEAAYARVGAAQSGSLDRVPYNWQRIRAPRDERADGFVVENAGAVVGWAFVKATRRDDGFQGMALTDLGATTRSGAAAVLEFLAAHRSMVRDLSWHSGPNDPFMLLLEERTQRLEFWEYTMTRILDVAAALQQRGYPRGVSALLDLELTDQILPENDGRWRVEVGDGAVQVKRGGSGALKMDVAALSPLYTGFESAAALALQGRVSGDADSLAIADSLFGGGTPWMRDMF